MATQQLHPPIVSCTRLVQLESPGGFNITIREDDFVDGCRDYDDETLARAYSEMTGLRATVKTLCQTTVSPVNPKYEEVVNG